MKIASGLSTAEEATPYGTGADPRGGGSRAPSPEYRQFWVARATVGSFCFCVTVLRKWPLAVEHHTGESDFQKFWDTAILLCELKKSQSALLETRVCEE